MLALSGRWKSLAFTAAAVVIGLLVLEGLVGLYFFLEDRYWPRILAPQPSQNQVERESFMAEIRAQQAIIPEGSIVMQEDDETGWALKPTAAEETVGVRVNSLGLRGGQLGPKREGETRLLFLGDSSVHGVRCAEFFTMPESAARELKTRLGTPVLGINGGVPGFDSGRSLMQLQQLFPIVAPDWVVIGNLWSDCYMQRGLPTGGLRGKRSLLAKTNTYRLLKRLLEPLLRSRKVGWFASKEEMRQAQIEDATVGPEQYLANLLAMADLAKTNGAHPVFLILPAPVDLTQDGVPEIVAEYRNLMRRAARESGAPVVDGPGMLAPRGVKLGHFLDEVHPGPELQQLLGITVARTIADEMAKSGSGEAGPTRLLEVR